MNTFETKLKDRLSLFLEIPGSFYVKLGLFVVLAALAALLFKAARHQYSPVVQQIEIKGDPFGASYHNQNVIAVLDKNLDDAVYYGARGEQFLNFQAWDITTAPPDLPVPNEISHLSEDSSAVHTKIIITASGEDFAADESSVMEKWGNYPDLPGLSRLVENKKNHQMIFDNYSAGGCSIDLAIRGDCIFTDKDSRNPHIAFYLTFDGITHPSSGGTVQFYYNHDQDDQKDKPLTSPIHIISVFPEPDYITPSLVSFSKNYDQIIDHGLYIIAEDLAKKRKNEVNTFLSSVFLGLVVSLCLQYLIGCIKDLFEVLKKRAVEQNLQ